MNGKAGSQALSAQILTAEQDIAREVPRNRREEIARYLRLFGYKPERTILQVHAAGSFGKKRYTQAEAKRRESALKRYGAPTFTVLGRTHDPAIKINLIPPRKKDGDSTEGYLGYLFAGKDAELRPPDSFVPLDFTPMSLHYPERWKEELGRKAYLIAMHVPSDFAVAKNEVHRVLRRLSSGIEIRERWAFIDKLEEYGYFTRHNINKRPQHPHLKN